nr:unnamed protein product [Digitaria exilis]
MSHFGRSGPPDIRDTFSLLVLNISFRGFVRICLWFLRSGDSRGFAFVRYKYADEAQKAIDRLDGGEMWMGGTSWYSLPSMAPMLSQSGKEGLKRRLRSHGTGQEAVVQGQGTEKEIIGGEVAAGAEIGMAVIGTGIIDVRAEAKVEAEAEAEAEVQVQVLTTKVDVVQEMMLSTRAGARAEA